MNMKNFLLLFCTLFPLFVFSQEVEDKESKFPLFEFTKGDDSEKNKSWGDYHFSNESYSKAIEKYEKINDPSLEIQRKLATSYWEIDSLDAALYILLKIVDNKQDIEPIDYYYLSQLLNIKGDYSEANKYRKKYSREKAREVRVSLFETDSSYYSRLLLAGSQYELVNLSTNTELSDFGGYAIRRNNKNVFIFASQGIQNIKKLSRGRYIRPERPTFNIFIGDFNEDSIQSSNARTLSGDINTEFQEGPGVLSEDGRLLVFTRSGSTSGKDDALHLNLYNASISNNGAVTRVRNLPFNNDQYSVMHPTLSKDRSRLYFSSNMPGGLGGFDLYYVRIQQNNKYSKPINLGPGINTEGNEVFPFIHRDDVLFFASDAHPGLGGLDIFLATGLGTESQDIENMGAPFNSSKDDFSLFLDKNFKYGLLSSNRSGGVGEDDIYSFKINIQSPYGIDDYYTISRGDTLVLGGMGVLANDEEIIISETNVLQILARRGTLLDNSTKNGNLDFNNNGTFTYIHENLKTRLDSFTYVVTNLAMESEPINVRIKIIDPTIPLAQEDIFVFSQNETIKVDPSKNILSNDSDPGGDKLKAYVIGEPSYGDITINDDGTFEYIPDDEIQYSSDTVFYAATDGIETDTSFVVFSKLKVGADLADIIEINPIYFDFDKDNIRQDASLELDKIVDVMNDYPAMVIELGSHTDCRGPDEYNLYLSDRRAKSSAQYIQERIDDKDRIYGKGYGETTPNVDCTPGCSSCNESEHQLNRRTEFIIVKVN